MRKVGLFVVLLIACSNDHSLSREEQYVAKLRKCHVLSEHGKADNLFDFTEIVKEDQCALGCMLKADCDELATLVCEADEPPGALGACFKKCYPDGEFFECEPGSGDYADRCDGYQDCEDGADEAACPDSAFFVCADGDRVAKDYRCDGESDCADDSDERGCRAGASPSFKCQDGEQIDYADAECDGERDCQDGSDEKDCVERGKLFACEDGDFVSASSVCDGAEDCDNGEDEQQDCATLQCKGAD